MKNERYSIKGTIYGNGISGYAANIVYNYSMIKNLVSAIALILLLSAFTGLYYLVNTVIG